MLNRPTEYLLQTCEAGGVPKISERRPLTRISVTKRASLGCVGGLGVFATLPAANPTQGAVAPSTFRNYAGPQHLCHYRGYDSAWVPGPVLGAHIGRSNLLFRIDLGLNELPWFLCTTRPLTQQGLILRKLRRPLGSCVFGVCCGLERKASQQRVRDRSSGQRGDTHRGGGRDRGARRCRYPVTQRHRPRETEHGPTALVGFLT